MPNPNIKYERKTGATSHFGKLRVSLNPLKPLRSELNRALPLENREERANHVAKMMDIGSLDPEAQEYLKKMEGSAVHRYNLFLIWLKSQTGQTLKEIIELENLFTIFKDRLFVDQLKKAADGEPLTKTDMQKMQMLAEVIEKLHTMKHGKKNVNVNVGYKDVRDMMFGEQGETNGNERRSDS